MNDQLNVDVVIVGAGPVGCLLGAELAGYGIDVAIFEPRTHPDPRPRAGTVHSRTLSQLARRGYIPSKRWRDVRDNAGKVCSAPFQFAGRSGLTLTSPAVEPAPIAGIPQQNLEAHFLNTMLQRGAIFLQGWTVTCVNRESNSVRVVACNDQGMTMTAQAQFVVGADGARSTVSKFGSFEPESTSPTMHAIAALSSLPRPTALPPGWHQTERGWTMVNPNPSGPSRVIALDFDGPALDRDRATTAKDHQNLVSAIIGKNVDLENTHAITTFSDYSRFTRSMTDGPLILIGDAAHVHFPLGGQGLNLGMQDAIDLGWRLSKLVARENIEPRTLLAEFSRARVASAQAVVANTILQSRSMNPKLTLGNSIADMLTLPDIHDAIADQISGEHQKDFVHDMTLTREGRNTTVAAAINHYGHIEIGDEATSKPNSFSVACEDMPNLDEPIRLSPSGYRLE